MVEANGKLYYDDSDIDVDALLEFSTFLVIRILSFSPKLLPFLILY